MALKGDRFEGTHDIKHFMNEVAERGGIASVSTAGSGSALDQSANLVTYKASGSGAKPVGILLTDMVNKDQTRTHINYQKNETQKGGKVPLLKYGFVVTNMIHPQVTPAGGDAAYVGASGLITNTAAAGGPVTGAESTRVLPIGEFETGKDEDGYATVFVNLPQRV